MNSHDLTVLGYLVILLVGGLLQMASRWRWAPVPPLGDVLTRIMHTRTGRVGVLVAWAWIGLHFFAR
jgi:hypothetical protein